MANSEPEDRDDPSASRVRRLLVEHWSATQRFYQFGATSFSNYVWIKGGFAFESPRGLDVEMENAGPFSVEVWDEYGGTLIGQDQRSNELGGWFTFDFSASGNFGYLPYGKYRIRFVNLGDGTRRARQGTLEYAISWPWEDTSRFLSAAVQWAMRAVGRGP